MLWTETSHFKLRHPQKPRTYSRKCYLKCLQVFNWQVSQSNPLNGSLLIHKINKIYWVTRINHSSILPRKSTNPPQKLSLMKRTMPWIHLQPQINLEWNRNCQLRSLWCNKTTNLQIISLRSLKRSKVLILKVFYCHQCLLLWSRKLRGISCLKQITGLKGIWSILSKGLQSHPCKIVRKRSHEL